MTWGTRGAGTYVPIVLSHLPDGPTPRAARERPPLVNAAREEEYSQKACAAAYARRVVKT
jgi:hypothetical protein